MANGNWQMATGSRLMRALRTLAIVEGVSLLVILLVTMPLKYWAGMPGANKVVGLAHGVLTVAYVSVLLYAWAQRCWSWRVLGWGLAASLVPMLPFWVERKVFAPLAAN